MAPRMLVVVLVGAVGVGNSFTSARQLQQAMNATCRVAVPNGIMAGQSERHEGSYGNMRLSVGPLPNLSNAGLLGSGGPSWRD